MRNSEINCLKSLNNQKKCLKACQRKNKLFASKSFQKLQRSVLAILVV